VAEIVAARPREYAAGRPLLVETFGSALSPLNDDELQVRLIVTLGMPVVLVTSSAVGAVGRTLQSLAALAASGLRPAAVVLLGPWDEYAMDQIKLHAQLKHAFNLSIPKTFSLEGVARSAAEQAATLEAIRSCVTEVGARVSTRADLSDIVERDRRAVWHPYTSLREPDLPLVVVEAQNEFLTLADGRRLIDGISSWWTILHGHRHPALMQALTDAATHYDHVHFAGVTHPPAVELAELMLHTMPWQGGRVFFSDDGSTAVEVALKMAYQYWCHHGEPQRTCFVGFDGGYHGDTFGAMAVGRDPVFFRQFEPLLFRAERLPVSADRLNDFLRRSGNQVAAVIIEPLVQGAGVCKHTTGHGPAVFTIAASGRRKCARRAPTCCHAPRTLSTAQKRVETSGGGIACRPRANSIADRPDDCFCKESSAWIRPCITWTHSHDQIGGIGNLRCLVSGFAAAELS
jgi:hypothetical protein